MDWSKQAEDMVRTWSEVQRKIWESWLAPMRASSGAIAQDEYGKAVEAWESSVKRALEAQVQWTRMWSEGLSAGRATSEVAAASAKQTHEMMRLWTDAHKQLWENWFTTLKQFDPARMAGASTWEQESQKVLQLWQDAGKAAQEAMTEWTALWTKGR